MASMRPLNLLARSSSRPATTTTLASILLRHHNNQQRPLLFAASFSTSLRRAALPMGPPPVGYRMPKPARWNTDGETALDKAGTYFLMTEMLRGMWVVLEQFFRVP